MAKVADLKEADPTILMYSLAGRGKTALALTLGNRCHYIDMDDNLSVAFGLHDQFRDDRLDVDVVQFLDKDPKTASAFPKAREHIKTIAHQAFLGKYEYDAVVLDSLTALATAAQTYIMTNSGMRGKNPQIQHWGMILNEIENVVMDLRSMNCLVFILAHQMELTADDATQIQIAVPGQKHPGKITRLFSEIWYLKIRPVGQGKNEFYIQTAPTQSVTCRSGRGLNTGTKFAVADKAGKPIESVGLWDIVSNILKKEPTTVT